MSAAVQGRLRRCDGVEAVWGRGTFSRFDVGKEGGAFLKYEVWGSLGMYHPTRQARGESRLFTEAGPADRGGASEEHERRGERLRTVNPKTTHYTHEICPH